MELLSQLTCPQCGRTSLETMPTDACIYFVECQSCQTLLRPKKGDCCVFCSYGSVPCPPVQVSGTAAGAPIEHHVLTAFCAERQAEHAVRTSHRGV